MNIDIDFRRDRYLSEFSIKTLQDRYLVGGEGSPQQAFARAAEAFADDEAHAQRLYDYASKLWFMFSTPILSNGGTKRGLPISCFLNYVDDSRLGLHPTTRKMRFFLPLVVALVATGEMYVQWAQRLPMDLSLPESYLL